MTVNNTTSQAELAYGNGITTAFPFAFEAMAPEQVGVMVNGAVMPNGHTVTLNAGGAGGTVTFTSPPASGAEVLSFSYPSFLQQVSFTNAGKFLPETHDAVADLGAIRDIYLLGRIGEALRGPPGSQLPALPDGDGVVVIEDGVPAIIPIDEFAPGTPGAPGGNVMSIGLFVNAAALTIPVGADLVQTSGYSIVGKGHAVYVADATVDAAYVTAHPRGAFRDTAGRGFRISAQGGLNVAQFGAMGDGIADDIAAFRAALAMASKLSLYGGWVYRGVPTVHVPVGAFSLSDTLDITDGSHHLKGASGSGSQNGGYASVLNFSAGKTGIRIQSWNTTGDTSRPDAVGASGAVIEDLWLDTPGHGGVTNADGVRVRAACTLRNVNVTNFIRDGIHIEAQAGAGGALEGNVNLFRISGGSQFRNGNCGIFIQGADTNAGIIEGVNTSNNGRWGIYDNSFLGNTIIGAHADENGTKGGGPPYSPNTYTSMVHYGGRRYYVQDDPAGASVNAPTGTTLSNTWWAYMHDGGPHTIFPTWFSGIPVAIGGAYAAPGLNARSVFLGCYSEGSQPPSVMGPTSMAIGGLLASGLRGAYLLAVASGLTASQTLTVIAGSTTPGNVIEVVLGGNVDNTFMQLGNASDGGTPWTFHIDANMVTAKFLYAGGSEPFYMLPPGNAVGMSFPRGLAVTGIGMTAGGGPPVAGTWPLGSVCWNSAPVAGGVPGWMCIAPGTPGTWKAMAPLAA